ncbi:MAG: PKD domain-containing protein [Lewinella sp.]|nr:PKD domain-containing protein [Lewinella sp.]
MPMVSPSQPQVNNNFDSVVYTWSISNVSPGLSNANINNPMGNQPTVRVNATGTGSFTVNLTVSDGGGCTASVSRNISVFGPLVPEFDTTYIGGPLSSVVNFTDQTANFPTSWSWNFGDPASSSNTSSAQNPSHSFSGPGTYTVSLTATRSGFCPTFATVTKQVTIGFQPVAKCDTIYLAAGLNVISLDVNPSNTAVTNVFADLVNNEPMPNNSNLNQVIGLYPDQSSFPLIFTSFFNSLSNVRPGFGYVVDVDVADTLIVCGLSLDPNIRVDLQGGLNIVGYIPTSPRPFTSYFDTLISDGNLLSGRTYENGSLLFWTPFVSTLTDVKNGLGFVLDLNAAYTGSQWRSSGVLSTSNFQYIYGSNRLGNQLANYQVEVLNAADEVVTTFSFDNEGNFEPTFLFGDLPSTREVEGFTSGETLRFRVNGVVSSTTTCLRAIGAEWY